MKAQKQGPGSNGEPDNECFNCGYTHDACKCTPKGAFAPVHMRSQDMTYITRHTPQSSDVRTLVYYYRGPQKTSKHTLCTLVVHFRKGSSYRYLDVPLQSIQAVLKADSTGSALRKHITSKPFTFTRLD